MDRYKSFDKDFAALHPSPHIAVICVASPVDRSPRSL